MGTMLRLITVMDSQPCMHIAQVFVLQKISRCKKGQILPTLVIQDAQQVPTCILKWSKRTEGVRFVKVWFNVGK